MIEVEAKLRISDKNLNTVRKFAKTLGIYIGKEKKVDDYYTLENLKKYPQKSLRIRKADGFFVINFKNEMSYSKSVYAKKETEFKVSDISGFIELIEDFGFKKWLRKEKETELYEIKRNFHIEINNVKGLGWFVEIECLCKSQKDVGKARNQINQVIKSLGLSAKNAVKEGYTNLIWNKS